MSEQYLWKVYVIGPPSRYETIISSTIPTVAPSDGSPINHEETSILASLFLNLTTPGYVNINSELADNQAIKINTSDANGGIDIDSGFGGITIDSTNTISLDANAESNFTTTNGNLILNATQGLLNIDGGAGINLGNNTTSPIYIGTSDYLKVINIGSTNTTSSTTINSGTGGIIIGNNANGGEIHIAAGAGTNKIIKIGNSETFSRIFTRYGTGGGHIKSQGSGVFVLGDQDTTILTSHLLAGILYGTSTTTLNLLLPSANDIITSIGDLQINDSIDFSVINLGTGTYTIVPGTNGTVLGNAIIPEQRSGLFRLAITNSMSYVIYRLS